MDQNLSSSLVVNANKEVVGIFTARDILRFIHAKMSPRAVGGGAAALERTITEVMTKREKLVFCSPADSVKRCREIMFQLKIRNMPVFEKVRNSVRYLLNFCCYL